MYKNKTEVRRLVFLRVFGDVGIEFQRSVPCDHYGGVSW